MTELKPCPFCSVAMEHYPAPNDAPQLRRYAHPTGRRSDRCWFDSKIIEQWEFDRWNRRPPPKTGEG